jgi:hypothetical protein
VYCVSRLRGGEPGTALWCRAVCAGRHCGACRRMRAVDAASRVADDAREPIVEARSTFNLHTEHWIRNTGMHDF